MHVYRQRDSGVPVSNREHLWAHIHAERSRSGVVETMHADLANT